MTEFKPFYWEQEKHHACTGMRYTARTEDYVLRDEEGNFEASMFTYSYTLLPEEASRPVLFCYNGGPGADSNWVHLGFLGPKTITYPGYPEMDRPAKTELLENPDFLLKYADIVCINPVGTQMTETTEAGMKKYLNVDGDCRSVADLIQWWLKKYGREEAPVYLVGESYGTIRNTIVADMLLKAGKKLKGIIYIGVSLNVAARSPMYVEPNVRRLGADAATVWYHFHQKECTFDSFVNEAMDFAYGDYAHALLVGNRLPEEERQTVADRLAYYTNLPKEKLLAQKLRFSEGDFLQGTFPNGVVSTYDSRVTLTRDQMTSDGKDELDFGNEPFMSKAGASVDTVMDEYIRSDLSVPEGRESIGMLNFGKYWSWESKYDNLTLPEELMKQYPDLTVMFANGYYDMQSTFDFVKYYLTQYDIPSDRLTVKFYQAGHAVYIGDGETQKQLLADVAEYLRK